MLGQAGGAVLCCQLLGVGQVLDGIPDAGILCASEACGGRSTREGGGVRARTQRACPARRRQALTATACAAASHQPCAAPLTSRRHHGHECECCELHAACAGRRGDVEERYSCRSSRCGRCARWTAPQSAIQCTCSASMALAALTVGQMWETEVVQPHAPPSRPPGGAAAACRHPEQHAWLPSGLFTRAGAGPPHRCVDGLGSDG